MTNPLTIISLNAWGGRANSELMAFLAEYHDVDVFCFQEVTHGATLEDLPPKDADDPAKNFDLFTSLGEALPGHMGFFRPNFKEMYGLAIFVKKDIKILEEGEEWAHKDGSYIPPDDIGKHGRNVQFVEIEKLGHLYTVMNFHGLWAGPGVGKDDTPDRIAQSQKLISFIEGVSNPCVLVGDFNLNPDTASLKMFEEHGLRNLISEYGITSTRTSLYPRPIRLADYAFVSPGITVGDFRVLPDEVSDHSPLFLEIVL